jgi:hypothetical protein
MRKTPIAFTFRQDLVFAQRHSIDPKESAEWFLRSHMFLSKHWPNVDVLEMEPSRGLYSIPWSLHRSW